MDESEERKKKRIDAYHSGDVAWYEEEFSRFEFR
jgi:hypothetical protein